jgi:hypothetical protein
MTDAEYYLIQSQVCSIAGLVQATLPPEKLKEFLRRIDLAESVGPVMDPTLFRQASEALDRIKQMADDLYRLSVTVAAFKPEEISGGMRS